MGENNYFVTQFKNKLLLREFNFKEEALKAFYFQYKSNPIYHTYCNHLGLNSQNVNNYEKIPFLPISFFKTHKINSLSLIHI